MGSSRKLRDPKRDLESSRKGFGHGNYLLSFRFECKQNATLRHTFELSLPPVVQQRSGGLINAQATIFRCGAPVLAYFGVEWSDICKIRGSTD
jgi:hypothetical protein